MGALRFAIFELDERTGELTRSGRRVPIARQAFKVLWLLASRTGDVVSRDELRQALWSDGTHVDFDRGLNFCVAAARRALGDDARRPRFIETLPRHGYRFVADVRVIVPAALIDAAPAAPVNPPALTPMPDRVPSSRLAAYAWPVAVKRWSWIAALLVVFAQGPTIVRAHTRETAVPQALAAFERGDFELALGLDPRFAEAHYALAERYKVGADRRQFPERAALDKARAAVARALALEEAPGSRRLLGVLRLVVDWDWEGARRDLARAVELAPAWDFGLAAYAEFLSAAGDDGAALDVMGRAEAVSPTCDLLFWQSAILHYRARQYETALDKLARAKALGPPRDRSERDWDIGRHNLAFLIHVQQQDWPAAQQDAIALAALHASSPRAGHRFAVLPARDAVAQFVAVSADLTRPVALRGQASKTHLALLSVLAGRMDEAVAWLERAVADREADLVFALRHPAFDALHARAGYRLLEASVRGTASSLVP